MPMCTIEDEKWTEHRETREDLEKGCIMHEELWQRNCVHWSSDFELVPWYEKEPIWCEIDIPT